MKTHLFSLVFLFFSLAQGLNPICDTQDHGSNLQVFHIYSPCSPFKPSRALSWEEDVLQMQAKDQARLQYLSSLVAKKSVVPVASGRQIVQSPTYIVRAKIGTPPQTMLMAMDTSNDAAWIPCTGCLGCASSVFDNAKSTTFKTLGCQAAQCKQVPNPTCGGSACIFNMTYGGSTIAANLSQDTVTLATDPVPSYTFGCLQKTSGGSVPPQGLLGLGRGPLSLLSQTQNLYKSTFSYCLPSFRSLNFSGSLRLGPTGQPLRIKYTPLLKNPRRPSLYFVNLIGIRVGRRIVDIPPNALAFNPTTGAGTIIDSGTVFTRLVEPAYVAVRNEFRRRVKVANVTSLGGFETCYTVPILAPTITFMFTGMNVTLAQDNLLIHSTAGSITCLAMASAPENVNSVLNVIANMQQQNHRVLFDVPNSRLGVARETCT
ncbi:aspartyl protease AED3-like [Durio zibethinus]|uniref:Aspartyl protease AED3-like n=1 Tax=Durio zibethinus TaxID=66656 RepID=A0A6P6AIU7_DURZI|nr:aspartyl protease AED3-like [Durio zibethinus]